jgi:hypothetical protein
VQFLKEAIPTCRVYVGEGGSSAAIGHAGSEPETPGAVAVVVDPQPDDGYDTCPVCMEDLGGTGAPRNVQMCERGHKICW